MLGKKVCLRTSESVFTYTFELQLQKPHISSHRAVTVDQMTADGEVRLRECEDARMRAKVMTWNACAAVREESGCTPGVACLGRNACDPFDQEISILRSTHVAESRVVSMLWRLGAGGSWGLRSISLDPRSEWKNQR